jgi:hypothetical protein
MYEAQEAPWVSEPKGTVVDRLTVKHSGGRTFLDEYPLEKLDINDRLQYTEPSPTQRD